MPTGPTQIRETWSNFLWLEIKADSDVPTSNYSVLSFRSSTVDHGLTGQYSALSPLNNGTHIKGTPTVFLHAVSGRYPLRAPAQQSPGVVGTAFSIIREAHCYTPQAYLGSLIRVILERLSRQKLWARTSLSVDEIKQKHKPIMVVTSSCSQRQRHLESFI
ncbi:hypothetical protein CBS147346_4494 [Aspergillus niger]|nr:hypothetical protein CBS147346_4494 [Aspergillus niger]